MEDYHSRWCSSGEFTGEEATLRQFAHLFCILIFIGFLHYLHQLSRHIYRLTYFTLVSIVTNINISLIFYLILSSKGFCFFEELFSRSLRPPHTSRFFVGLQKIFTCRLVCGEFRQFCDKIGACRVTVLDLRTSCRALSASVRWSKQFVGARAYLGQWGIVMRITWTSLFSNMAYVDRLGPKTKRG